MKIVKEFRYGGDFSKKYYAVRFTVMDREDRSMYIFLENRNLFKENTVYIDINNLNIQEFYEKNNIEYVIEKEENGNVNIIPIGLVDFIDEETYRASSLGVCNFDGNSLENANKILKNIDKAIELKYEALKFVNKFKARNNVEEIEFD
ncbi:hypothetical protein [Clostridium intestinale]|uniref:hypothetical protein n=1 Tax=Clostridium intestinale TaxID=36845 RepID=UPI0028F07CFF|nr:hypothetical protein [Clostridium intestinale]